MTLRTHQPFESIEKAIHEDEDIESSSERIYTAPHRILIGDTDEGQRKRTEIDDLEALTEAYGNGLIREKWNKRKRRILLFGAVRRNASYYNVNSSPSSVSFSSTPLCISHASPQSISSPSRARI